MRARPMTTTTETITRTINKSRRPQWRCECECGKRTTRVVEIIAESDIDSALTANTRLGFTRYAALLTGHACDGFTEGRFDYDKRGRLTFAEA